MTSSEMQAVKLYNLQLHEKTDAGGNWRALRVPGGWIYTNLHSDDSLAVFVPFNNEFQKR